MKEYTPARATKTLAFLADEKRRLLDLELEGCVRIVAEDGTPEDETGAYSYALTRSKIAELDRKTAVLRHALHQFENQAVLEESGITVDEARIRLGLMGKEKRRLAALRNIPDKRRVETGLIIQGPLHEYECANYDAQRVERDYLNLCASMEDLRGEIGTVSHTQTFAVDI